MPTTHQASLFLQGRPLQGTGKRAWGGDWRKPCPHPPGRALPGGPLRSATKEARAPSGGHSAAAEPPARPAAHVSLGGIQSPFTSSSVILVMRGVSSQKFPSVSGSADDTEERS